MAPTSELDTKRTPTSSPSPCDNSSNNSSKSSSPEPTERISYTKSIRDPFDVALSLQDFDNSCETYFCSRDITPSPRSVIPEPSPAFRQAMGKLKLERTDSVYSRYSMSSSALSPSPISSTTLPSKAITASKLEASFNKSQSSTPMSSSSSSSRSLASSLSSSKVSSSSSPSQSFLSPYSPDSSSAKSSRPTSGRRPASFGGSDVVKPRTSRRASHCEKRVTWADEQGRDHQLISVRLIKPRISMETSTSTSITPKHSILRNTGIH